MVCNIFSSVILTRLHVCVRTCILLTRENRTHKTGLTPSLVIEVPAPNQECVRGITFVSVYDLSVGYLNCSDSVVLSVFDFIALITNNKIILILICCIVPSYLLFYRCISFKSVLSESSARTVNNVSFYLLKFVRLFPVRTVVNSSSGNCMGISDSFVTSDILYLSLAIQSVDCVHLLN